MAGDLLCPRHEVEAWLAKGCIVAVGDWSLIARLTARDAVLREAAAQLADKEREGAETMLAIPNLTPQARRECEAWLAPAKHIGIAIRTAPLVECPQCRAEGKEERR